jgi:hypothetical protein
MNISDTFVRRTAVTRVPSEASENKIHPPDNQRLPTHKTFILTSRKELLLISLIVFGRVEQILRPCTEARQID